MDNEHKIAERQSLTHKEVQYFLKDELKPLEYSKKSSYNLTEEYEKTGKNKNKGVTYILLGTFIGVLLLTGALALFIASGNRKIKININTFGDLNLQSLLNTAGRVQSKYQTALNEKEELMAMRDNELAEARQKRENELFTLSSVSRVASEASLKARREKIQNDYETVVAEIQKKYKEKIDRANEEINALNDQFASYEGEQLTQAREQEAVLDSQKQLNDLQLKSVEKRYQTQITDLKAKMASQQKRAVEQQRAAVEEVRKTYQAKIDLLDPDARAQSSTQDKIILDTGIPKWAKSTSAIEFKERFDGSRYTDGFAAPSENFKNSIENAEKTFDDLNTIANRFYTIPLENTIRHYVPAIQRLAYQLAEEMADGQKAMQGELDTLNKNLEEKNRELSDYGVFFEAICNEDKSNPSQGAVISAANRRKISLYMTSAGKAVFGEQTSLPAQIRSGRKVICEATLVKEGALFYAVPLDSKKADSIENGQKVYIVTPKDNKK